MKPSSLGAERRGPRRVQPGEGAAEVDGVLRGRPARLDPGQDQALGVVGEHLGHGDGAGLGQPGQSRGLGLEEPDRRVRAGLDDRGPPVGEPQPGRRADVAAGDRVGRDHRRAEQSLGPLRDRRHRGHDGQSVQAARGSPVAPTAGGSGLSARGTPAGPRWGRRRRCWWPPRTAPGGRRRRPGRRRRRAAQSASEPGIGWSRRQAWATSHPCTVISSAPAPASTPASSEASPTAIGSSPCWALQAPSARAGPQPEALDQPVRLGLGGQRPQVDGAEVGGLGEGGQAVVHVLQQGAQVPAGARCRGVEQVGAHAAQRDPRVVDGPLQQGHRLHRGGGGRRHGSARDGVRRRQPRRAARTSRRARPRRTRPRG